MALPRRLDAEKLQLHRAGRQIGVSDKTSARAANGAAALSPILRLGNEAHDTLLSPPPLLFVFQRCPHCCTCNAGLHETKYRRRALCAARHAGAAASCQTLLLICTLLRFSMELSNKRIPSPPYFYPIMTSQIETAPHRQGPKNGLVGNTSPPAVLCISRTKNVPSLPATKPCSR